MIIRDKMMGTATAVLAAASFMVFPQVQAAPVFPPEHVSAAAAFVSGTRSDAHSVQPWYRPQAPREIARATVEPQHHLTVSASGQAWYRAAN